MSAASPAEWAAFLSLGIGIHAALSAPYFLLVDADHFAWPHPLTTVVSHARPVLWDVTRSEAVYRVLSAWDIACHASRDAFRDVAALLILLTTRPQGALR